MLVRRSSWVDLLVIESHRPARKSDDLCDLGLGLGQRRIQPVTQLAGVPLVAYGPEECLGLLESLLGASRSRRHHLFGALLALLDFVAHIKTAERHAMRGDIVCKLSREPLQRPILYPCAGANQRSLSAGCSNLVSGSKQRCSSWMFSKATCRASLGERRRDVS
jgi:hypothetical protein